MDITLFTSLIQRLLNVTVMIPDSPASYADFADKFCYHPLLQPAFTVETLVRLTPEMQETTFYGFQDDIGVNLLLFKFAGHPFLVGPFVRNQYNENRIQTALLKHQMPASFAPSIRLYYESFPIISATHVRSTILSCIQAFSGQNRDYSYIRLQADSPDMTLPTIHDESLDYSSLHHRYDLENRFLRMIETGDTENVIIAKDAMTLQGLTDNRNVNAIYMNYDIGLAMLRALARKAAERGGASIIEIHEITQRAMQKMAATKGAKEHMAISDRMILELTEAVRRAHQVSANCSLPIRKVLERIHLNYSQNLSLASLAQVAHLSETYLSKTFKKEVGMTISQYTEHLRCQKAAEMLRGTTVPIQDISHYVGYPDNNYFVKVFKKQLGMTPTEYRHQTHA